MPWFNMAEVVWYVGDEESCRRAQLKGLGDDWEPTDMEERTLGIVVSSSFDRFGVRVVRDGWHATIYLEDYEIERL